MKRFPFTELQTALYAALGSVTDLSSVSVPRYDEVPEGQAFPYIVIGEFSGELDDTQEIIETTYTIRAWSDYPGSRELLHLIEQIRQAVQFRHQLTNNFELCDEGVTDRVGIEDVTEDGADRTVRVATIEHTYMVQDLR